MATSQDKQVLALIEQVKAQKASIASLSRPNYKTNMTFYPIPGQVATSYNLNTISAKDAIFVGALILEKEQYFAESAERLGLSERFDWGGFSVEDWFHDLNIRVAKLQINEKRQKLAALEARLDAVISPELRRKMELEAIVEALNE